MGLNRAQTAEIMGSQCTKVGERISEMSFAWGNVMNPWLPISFPVATCLSTLGATWQRFRCRNASRPVAREPRAKTNSS